MLLVPMPDQQVGADAHDLPADQQHQQVVRDHDREHRAGEQGQDDVEPREPHVAVHVAERVHVDGERDGCDDDEHHRREAVDVLPHLEVERPDL